MERNGPGAGAKTSDRGAVSKRPAPVRPAEPPPAAREGFAGGPKSDVVAAAYRAAAVEPARADDVVPAAPVEARRTAGWAPRVALAWPRPALLQSTFALLRMSPVLASFVGCVLAPAFAATVYFAAIASDQMAAEARFAVRQIDSDSSETTASVNGASSGGGASVDFAFTAPAQNAYIVTSYIRSRAIVDDLDASLDLRQIFRRPEADFWARLKRDASIDELTEYWKSMVTTYVDAPSGIVTLDVRAFRADDAVTLAKAVLTASESLVNRISDRARRDAMAVSEQEVRRTYELTQTALADLRKFRDSAGIIDPVQAGTEIGKLLLPLLTEKIRLESDLFVASRDLDQSAPTVKALKSRLDTTEQQIAALKARLTGTDGSNKTVAASLAKFEELDLKRQFAEKLYTLAQADLDRARLRAARQSVYLTVFVPPSLPEESRYPRRVAFPILIFLGLTVLWAIGAMVVASVEDHRL